jgi:hypothetical protein
MGCLGTLRWRRGSCLAPKAASRDRSPSRPRKVPSLRLRERPHALRRSAHSAVHVDRNKQQDLRSRDRDAFAVHAHSASRVRHGVFDFPNVGWTRERRSRRMVRSLGRPPLAKFTADRL